ncbi:MAG: hypothetical protein CGU28_00225 [Candidatus Dactylopiibacterium carminicum]|uniref:DUF4115 domain-containing protein n=1 Tax=Candidatus Dactylopiibacterium carminicum TaxID=857335 RepID=A0A272F0H4_9RHOO|nr:helix-turn-helix domain-containing protein [Candidatus Dactylopiibacterium carminicum]KAF7600871.1 DUF4115 domain-containing protein [Candidatus Dactylopiibacterium carminicum]PAS95370.1 MAG: hypothetical protein CGU29_00585 [Candidatus Dactylopiibacterium carminicum]PAS98619.1 MAG: hypothetical protein CGU28_00225 [Candidatus Dactylopiibacterium carminicum]
MSEQETEARTSPWQTLREAREARGLSLQDVSAHLKLAPRQLEAIERGEYERLPGLAFARGFVRNYARFLGVDAAACLKIMDGAEKPAPAEVASQMTTPSLGRMPTPGDSRYSALPAALVVLAILVVLGAGWYFRWFEARDTFEALGSESAVVMSEAALVLPKAEDPTPGSISEPLLQAPAASAPEASAVAVSSVSSSHPAPAAAPVVSAPAPALVSASVPTLSAAAPRLVFTFSGESWVEVRDAEGRLLYSRLNQPGSVQEVQGTPPFDLVIGNAPRVKLVWRDKPVDLVSATRGEVARLKLQ